MIRHPRHPSLSQTSVDRGWERLREQAEREAIQPGLVTVSAGDKTRVLKSSQRFKAKRAVSTHIDGGYFD